MYSLTVVDLAALCFEMQIQIVARKQNVASN